MGALQSRIEYGSSYELSTSPTISPYVTIITSKAPGQNVLFYVKREKLRRFHVPDADKVIRIRNPDLCVDATSISCDYIDTGVFPKWSYRNGARRTTIEDDKDKILLFRLLQIYRLASKCKVSKIKDDIVNHIMARSTCGDGFFSNYLVTTIYGMTNNSSGLRRYLIDMYLFKTRDWCDDKLDERNTSYMEDGNYAFVNDCFRKQRLLIKNKKVAADPNKKKACDYHDGCDGLLECASLRS